MMPTSPSSSLRFPTAGFPQYGSKAGLSSDAFPGDASHHTGCIRPSCRLPPKELLLVLRRASRRSRHRRASGLTALPQGPSLRSGL